MQWLWQEHFGKDLGQRPCFTGDSREFGLVFAAQMDAQGGPLEQPDKMDPFVD
jgi:hypothetical protein